MRGLWIEDGALSLRDDLAPPERGDGDCRVRPLVAGVCATDLALLRGYMGFRGVPGHEFCGLALDGPLVGERVVGEINAACGDCPTCRAGRERHCPTRTVLGILDHGGAFAEELVLPTANLHRVPDGLSSEAATFTEPLAAAFEIAEQLDLGSFERALVVGDGRLGLLCAQVLALSIEEVSLVGRHPERSALLAGVLPAALAERLSWIERSAAETNTAGWDLVVEASGAPETFAWALARVRPKGTLVLKTTAERPAEVDLAPLVVNEVTVVGSRCGPFAPALEALAAGRIAVEPLIAARYPLEEGGRAFARAGERGILKVLVTLEGWER